MHWRQTEANHYHAQLGLLDKGHVIKEFIVYWVLLHLIPRVFERKRRDFDPLGYPGLLDLRCCYSAN